MLLRLVIGSCDPTAHAEVNAIIKAGQILGSHDFSGC
jgi:tRNA(Arg) A34 adenosine deaminase TadA